VGRRERSTPLRRALQRWSLTLVYALDLAVVGAVVGCVEPPPPDAPEFGAGAGDDTSTPNALLWPGRFVGDLYRPGEVRAFEFRRGGVVVGRSWGRYEGAEALVEGDRARAFTSPVAGEAPRTHGFTTRIELFLDIPLSSTSQDDAGSPGARGGASSRAGVVERETLRSEGRVEVDDAGRILRGEERSQAAEITFERIDAETLELRYAAAGGLGRVEGLPEREAIAYDEDAAAMAFMATIHEELFLATRALHEGKASRRLVSLSGGAPIEWSADVARVEGAVELRTNLGERVRFVSGRIEHIAVIDDELEVVSVAAEGASAWPSWTLPRAAELRWAPPADGAFAAREVELPGRGADGALAGEILVPAGVTAPRAAVLFLAAGGTATRHGFAGPPPADLGSHEITDALARAGYVVLRYDEPGRGLSAPVELSWASQLEDARRGLRTLMVQPEVDPARVVVVGHGEGGLRAMSLASEHPREIAAVVLLGTSSRSLRTMLDQAAQRQAAQLSPEARSDMLREQRALVEAIETGVRLPDVMKAQARWLRELLDVEPAKLAERVRVPTFVAVGEKDFEIEATRDLDGLARALRKGRSAVHKQSFRGLDHLFKREDGVSTPKRYLEPRPVDRGFLEALIGWLAGSVPVVADAAREDAARSGPKREGPSR
jgi:pimeloyl-ACP methyl ester carboxylesterase